MSKETPTSACVRQYSSPACFSLGVLDPVDHAIHWFRYEAFRCSGDGSFEIRGLGREQYVIRTTNHDAVCTREWERLPWVSGNVLVDTRAGSIAGLEVRLRAASKLALHFTGQPADGMRSHVADERGLELGAGSLDGPEPRPFPCRQGNYSVALLDAGGTVLSERSVTLGSETVELNLAH